MNTITCPPDIPAFSSVCILGLNIHRVDMRTALRAIDCFVRRGTPHHVITADASMLVMAQDDPDLRRIIQNAALVTPDSAGVLWAARRCGCPLRERVSGVEIVENLCALSPERGYRIYFLGAGPGVAEEAARRMQHRYPGVRIVGARHGYFTPQEEADVIADIRESGADIVCVAMGIPRQEKWIDAHCAQLGASVLIGVGGTFDVLSGQVRRAPRWMQRARLEWLWRLCANPRKIHKVMLLPRFVRLVLRATSGKRWPG